jgi:prolyl-tRNA synthetase
MVSSRINRLSQILLPTSKQSVRNSKNTNLESSHELLLRGGFIRQSSSGLFTLLPFGLLVLKKIEKLIDGEMKKIGGQKVCIALCAQCAEYMDYIALNQVSILNFIL